MLVVAGLLWRSKRAALWLYAALLLATMIWGVWEVGFDFWALTPRSDIWCFRHLANITVCLASAGGSFQWRSGGAGRGVAD